MSVQSPVGAGSAAEQVALVTGGAERVGRTIVRRLADAGFTVAVNHFGQGELAEETVALVEGGGGAAFAVEADVTDPDGCRALVEAVTGRAGRLDVLVHNASNFVGGPFLEVTPEDFDRSFSVNLRGPFFLSQAAARVMLAQGSGRIIALGGDSYYESWPQYVAHGVSKSALVRLMQVLAVALSPTVQCTAVCPAKILSTDDGSNEDLYLGRGQRSEGGLQMGRDVVLRTGGPEDVAETIAWLARCTPYLNGAVVPLDGGKSVY